MKYNGNGFTPAIEIPSYTNVGDIVLIGTVHNSEVNQRKWRRLKDELEGCQYLFFEGTQADAKLREYAGLTGYERRALNYFKRPVHFLEDGLDYVDLAQEYGISPSVFGIYDVLRVLPQIIAHTSTSAEFMGYLKRYLEMKKKIPYPGYDKVDIEDVIHKIPVVMAQTSPGNARELGEVFNKYLARLREYERLGPRSRELDQQLTGRKGEIVGVNHVDYLVRCLHGERMEVPEDWHAFIKGTDYRDAIRRIERL